MDTLDRKERNRVFRSIEEGDFGDDWPTGVSGLLENTDNKADHG